VELIGLGCVVIYLGNEAVVEERSICVGHGYYYGDSLGLESCDVVGNAEVVFWGDAGRKVRRQIFCGGCDWSNCWPESRSQIVAGEGDVAWFGPVLGCTVAGCF
jgi:hypothetical protein